MRLIPNDKRNNFKCVVCGKQPVKYFIRTFLSDVDEMNEREYAFCSLCALRFANELRDRDTCFQDEEK